MFDVPPLFRYLKEESGTGWEEMYKVFNMGHRMEIYTDAGTAESMVGISKAMGVDARIIGKVEDYPGRKVTLKTNYGDFEYEI